MSANIHWRPVSRNDKTLDVPAPSAFQEKMAEAGLALPTTVGQSDIPILKGLAAGYGRDKDRPNPFDQILKLVQMHGSVELWAVY